MQELLLKEALDAARSAVKWWRNNKHQGEISIRTDRAELCLERHLIFVENWSRQISLRELPRSRSLGDIFINLSLTENPLRGELRQLHSDHLLSPGLHSVLLGHPGAGKTTIVKMLCQKLIHDEPDAADKFSFPLLVLLRDLRQDESLVDHLLELLGIEIVFATTKNSQRAIPSSTIHAKDANEEEDASHEIDRAVAKKVADEERQIAEKKARETREKEAVLVEYLNNSTAFLLLDGLDELRPEHGLKVKSEIGRLANMLGSSKFVLTCRRGAFDITLDNSETLYLCPLDEMQVHDLVSKWLESENQAESFLSSVRRSPYSDTIGRPLVLVNLCMVYERYQELPEPHTLIYQKVVQLLLEQWDGERDLRRTSRYGRFGPERKRQFLGSLAYNLFKSFKLGGPRYRESELREAYGQISELFSLPADERDQVLLEIESHTGLFVGGGLGTFEFSHKSLQEYLCADHIIRLPDLKPELTTLAQMPNECAIATVLSASPNGFLELLAFHFATPMGRIYRRDQVIAFWNPYLTRLKVEGAIFSNDLSLGFTLLFISSLVIDGLASGTYGLVEGNRTFIDLMRALLSEGATGESAKLARGMLFVRAKKDFVECQIEAIRRTFKPEWLPDQFVVPKECMKVIDPLLRS